MEEEKKAIEKMTNVRDKNVHTFVNELTIVLNLIEKQKAEIEDKQDEINVLEAQRDSIENQFEQAKKEIEKKDKIIDLMAEAICYESIPTEEYCVFRNFDCPVVGGNRECKECVKKYAEYKVEEDK